MFSQCLFCVSQVRLKEPQILLVITGEVLKVLFHHCELAFDFGGVR